MSKTISFFLNGKPQKILIEENITLLELLRERYGMIGSKEGCGAGECGACTILINDKAVTACLVLAQEIDGDHLTTIEGLSDGDKLHPLQESFIKYGAIQCGFCTSGMILSALALLKRKQKPSEEEVREAIAGNLCRCTGYTKIVKAILTVAHGEFGGEV